jgi:hypothetical protein
MELTLQHLLSPTSSALFRTVLPEDVIILTLLLKSKIAHRLLELVMIRIRTRTPMMERLIVA